MYVDEIDLGCLFPLKREVRQGVNWNSRRRVIECSAIYVNFAAVDAVGVWCSVHAGSRDPRLLTGSSPQARALVAMAAVAWRLEHAVDESSLWPDLHAKGGRVVALHHNVIVCMNWNWKPPTLLAQLTVDC